MHQVGDIVTYDGQDHIVEDFWRGRITIHVVVDRSHGNWDTSFRINASEATPKTINVMRDICLS